MPKYISKGLRATWSEDQLQAAAHAIDKGSSVRAAAKAYGIPEKTLRHRLKVKNFTKEKLGQPPVLGWDIETKIIAHLNRLQKAGYSPTRTALRKIAYNLAEQMGKLSSTHFSEENRIAGKGWMLAFLKRHPNLSIRKDQGVSKARAEANEEETNHIWRAFPAICKEELDMGNEKNTEIKIEAADPTSSFNGDVSNLFVESQREKSIDRNCHREGSMSVPESESVEIGDVVLQSFIATYEQLPLLWNPTDTNYKNKNKRNAALAKLLSIYKKCKPGATIVDVRRKINTLRSNFWKEIKKIEDSKRLATRADEIFSPSSWVFYALQFINNVEHPIDSQEQFDEHKEEEDNDNDIQGTTTSMPVPSVRPKRLRTIGPIARQKKLLQNICAYIDSSSNVNNATEMPTIAKVWGEKLVQLHPQQRALAEKAINDILFEASQGTLHRNSVKINEGFSYPSSTVASPHSSVDTPTYGPSP